MAGKVTVAIRKKVDRIPLSIPTLKRTGGDPAFRDTGFSRLLYREKEIADTVHMMYRAIPTNVLADYATGKNDKALGLEITLALAPFGTVIEEELVEQFNESGDYAAREWSRDISRAWSRLGKEVIEDVTPSKLALGFRFDRASPAATKWAKQEAGKLVTDIIESQKLAVRAVVQQAYTDGRTVHQSARALVDILKEIAPTSDIGQMLAEQYAVNTAGLFPRYATAVANYSKKQAEILAKQGITGTKALETVTKRSQRYADKLRRSRAKMIARTEIMRANNQGKLESAYQAVSKGFIDPNTTKRQWSTAPMDVCNICAPMNGVTIGMYDSWSIGDPPAHPNCRCTWRLLPRANTYGVPQAQIYGPGGLGPGGPGISSFTFPKLPDVPKVGAPVVNPLPPAEAPIPATPQPLPAQNMPGTAIADDVLPAVADDLAKPPQGLNIEEFFPEEEMGISVAQSWDELSAQQKKAYHNLADSIGEGYDDWADDFYDDIQQILFEEGKYYDDALDDVLALTDPIDPTDVVPASTIDDSLPVNHPDNMLVSDVDAQVASLYQKIPFTDDDLPSTSSISDALNKHSLKAGPYKNSPHRLQFIDELAITIIQEGNLSTVPAWLKQISLPPGMKKLDKKGFADARWRIGDYVKKGLLTADEADSFKALLGEMQKVAFAENLTGGFGSTVVSFQNKLIKFNQTLAQRMRANSTATGVKIPKNSLAGRFVDDQLAYAEVADDYLTKLDEFTPDAWEQLLPYGNFKHTIKNPPSPSDMGTYTPTVSVGAPKPKKQPKAWSNEPLDSTFRPQNPDDLPFAVDELIELKGENAVLFDRYLPLGGTNQKTVYVDPTTNKQWIFKPQPKWQSELDRATSELQRRLGLQGAETHVVDIDGVVGSIQEVIGDQLGESTALFAGKTFDATKLSVAQIEQMQANYIFDHLISNYDSHAENFLRLKSAVDPEYLPIAIDKGQAFKHLGKTGEGLLDDWMFNPNNNAPSGNPLSLLFEQFAEGKGVPLKFMDDSERLQRMVRSVKDLADDGVLEDVLMPYLIEAEKAGIIDSAMDTMDVIIDRWSGIFDSVRKLEDKLMKTVGGAARASVDDVLTSLALPPASAFIDSSVDWANKKMKPITDALSETQRRAVSKFTGSDYSTINESILRNSKYRGANGLIGESDFIKTNRRTINQIDKAMSPIEQDVTLYRNAGRISLPDGQILDPANAVGKVLGDFGFQSTSVGKPVGMGNQNLKLKMRVMKGVKGVWAKPISRHATEDELLLQRGLRMVVTGAKKNGSQWELDVVVVPDDFKGIPEVIKQKATGKG